jgi:TonB family protein
LVPVDYQIAEPELNLLYDWDRSLYPPQTKKAVWGSLAVHALLIGAVFLAPPSSGYRPPLVPATVVDRAKSTPLIAPRSFELTQTAPNRGRVSREVTLDDLMPETPRPATRPAPRRFTAPAAPNPAPTAQALLPVPEPPQLGQTKIDVPDLVTPPLPVNEKPKLAFENPGAQSGTPNGRGQIPVPKPATVDEAIRQTVRNRATGGTVVTDVTDLPSGGGATLSPSAKPGQAGSRLELLSDPQGVDFQPYLIRVLAAVRRNWFAVIPESARFGQRGRVVIQFAISREGRVPKLVISLPSGADALDRAAVAGISASNPFPPLPAEFKGEQIRLQLSFLYNMPQ